MSLVYVCVHTLGSLLGLTSAVHTAASLTSPSIPFSREMNHWKQQGSVCGEAGCRKFTAVPCHSDPLQMSPPAGVMDGVGLLRQSLVNSEGHPRERILPSEKDPGGMLI